MLNNHLKWCWNISSRNKLVDSTHHEVDGIEWGCFCCFWSFADERKTSVYMGVLLFLFFNCKLYQEGWCQDMLFERLVLLCYKITLKSRMHWQSGSSIRGFRKLLILDNFAQLWTPPLGGLRRVLWQNLDHKICNQMFWTWTCRIHFYYIKQTSLS